jgi:glycosyltransferase domain-containing protein
VVDSSEKKFDWGYETITYIYAQGTKVTDKLNNTIKLIKTKYTLFCADDDFVISDSIEKCLEFLENNQDYSSVQGRHYYYSRFNNNTISTQFNFESLNLDINSDSSLGRVKQLGAPVKLWMNYALHKTQNFRDIYNFANGYMAKEIIFAGLSYQYLSILRAKHKVLDIPYLYREWNPNSGGYKMRSLERVLIDEEGRKFFKMFKLDMARYFSQIDKQISEKEAILFFENFFDLYLNTNYSNSEKNLLINDTKKNNIKLENIEYNIDPSDTMDNNINTMISKHKSIYPDKNSRLIDDFRNRLIEEKDIYIYGAGLSALLLYMAIESLNINSITIKSFIDDYKSGSINKITVNQLSNITKDSFILVSPTKYSPSIIDKLNKEKYSNYLTNTSDFFDIA